MNKKELKVNEQSARRRESGEVGRARAKKAMPTDEARETLEQRKKSPHPTDCRKGSTDSEGDCHMAASGAAVQEITHEKSGTGRQARTATVRHVVGQVPLNRRR